MPRKINKKSKAMPEEIIYEHIANILDEDTPAAKVNASVNIILKQFTPLMFKHINYYKKTRKDLRDVEDLESAARMALVKAIQKFNPEGGAKFITFLSNGLRHELIGAYRKMVKQGLVEAVNESTYFHKNDKSIDVSDSLLVYKNEDSLENREETLIFMEDIISNVNLTIGESLYFFMHYGIFCDKYSHKDIKKMFGLNKVYLFNAQLKVFSYIFNKNLKKKEDIHEELKEL